MVCSAADDSQMLSSSQIQLCKLHSHLLCITVPRRSVKLCGLHAILYNGENCLSWINRPTGSVHLFLSAINMTASISLPRQNIMVLGVLVLVSSPRNICHSPSLTHQNKKKKKNVTTEKTTMWHVPLKNQQKKLIYVPSQA